MAGVESRSFDLTGRDANAGQDHGRARGSRWRSDREVHVPTRLALVRMHQARGEDGELSGRARRVRSVRTAACR